MYRRSYESYTRALLAAVVCCERRDNDESWRMIHVVDSFSQPQQAFEAGSRGNSYATNVPTIWDRLRTLLVRVHTRDTLQLTYFSANGFLFRLSFEPKWNKVAATRRRSACLHRVCGYTVNVADGWSKPSRQESEV